MEKNQNSFFDNLSTKSKILIAVTVPFLMMLTVSLIVYISIEKNTETTHWVEHTHQVMADSNELIKLLVDMETGKRGFLITGNEVFLQPYIAAREIWTSKLKALKRLVSDNPVQVARLTEIESLQKKWLKEAAFVEIAARQDTSMSPELVMAEVVRLVELQTGKNIIDQIRAIKANFNAMEQSLMKRRQQESAQAASQTLFVVIAGTLLSLLLALIVAALVASHISRKLKTLMSGTTKIEQGDYQTVIELHGNDEFSLLAKAFNNMSLAVKFAVDEMEKAVKTKSSFLANMSHEIRTPMNGILGMLTLLENSKLNKEQQEYTSAIRSCGDGLLIVINDILDISKLEAGKLSLDKQAFNLRSLIEEVTFLLDSLASEKGLTLKVTLDEELAASYEGDNLRLRQILLNLLSNAIKFTAQGTVELIVKAVEKGTDEDKLLFNVIDQGIGISVEDQEKLFKPFSQVDTSISRDFGGTGLGLIICAKLVEKMQGNISVLSTVGEGSTFSFELTLPVVHRQTQAVEQTNHQQQLLQVNANLADEIPLSILVVEDNKINQIIIRKIFEKLGYSVDIANHGEEGVQAVQSKVYDTVFMDMQMPVMDGVTATNKIIELQPDNHPTIIAMTANVLAEDRQKCFDAGMDNFINKPINVEDIVQAIRMLNREN
ncbi:CHASE3 domain-containing protein [Litorilituus lipolyticus]|uniref:Sensory/regulatory protein RpfC n=1 Tax=Litorilituus lipolyticus TaxID=2491017 RepID=A0A502KV92_9GAMM|nr:CHASE3 domain-containing protein [Litorilituus lipolyticus]TPH15640.1 response regulator [Litorilituus lipolyticus]